MKTISEILKYKPSRAIEAMLKGLEEAETQEGFKIDMGFFGWVSSNNVCFGCAATCALQEISGKKFSSDNIESNEYRARLTGFDMDDQIEFESAMDLFRSGSPYRLFSYMGLPWSELSVDQPWTMRNNWRISAPAIEIYLKKLKSAGL